MLPATLNCCLHCADWSPSPAAPDVSRTLPLLLLSAFCAVRPSPRSSLICTSSCLASAGFSWLSLASISTRALLSCLISSSLSILSVPSDVFMGQFDIRVRHFFIVSLLSGSCVCGLASSAPWCCDACADQKDCMMSQNLCRHLQNVSSGVLPGVVSSFVGVSSNFFRSSSRFLRAANVPSSKKNVKTSVSGILGSSAQCSMVCHLSCHGLKVVRRLSRRHDLPRRADCHCRLQLTSGLPWKLLGPNHWPHCSQTNSSCPEFKGHDGTVEIVILDVCYILFY